jgi:hypothetical protein
MTPGGWISLILSVGGVLTLFSWCIYRVLKAPEREHDLAHIEPQDRAHADE